MIRGRLREGLAERFTSLVRTPQGGLLLAATTATGLAHVIDRPLLERVAKPLLAPAALAAALRPGRPAPVDTALLALTGAAYTTGDVVLMVGEGHSGHDTRRIVAGAASFAVGHVALGAVLLRAGVRPRPVQSAVHTVAGFTVATRLLLEDARGQAPLAAYCAVLASLSALVTSLDVRALGPAAAVAVAGGPSFVLSDTLILVRRAVPASSAVGRALDVAVIDTYVLAALLLLSGGAAAARTRRNR